MRGICVARCNKKARQDEPDVLLKRVNQLRSAYLLLCMPMSTEGWGGGGFLEAQEERVRPATARTRAAMVAFMVGYR
jgi:hypothetical protein